MKKILPLLWACVLLTLSNCTSSTPSAETQKAALEEKEAATLDSISNALERNKAEIQESLQKLDESLNAIED